MQQYTRHVLFALVFALPLLGGCAEEETVSDAAVPAETVNTTAPDTVDPEVIRTQNSAFGEAFDRGDGAGLAALYTDDAQLLPPGGEPITGTEAIGSFWQGVMDSGVQGAQLETTELFGGGDTATEVGRYTLTGADGQTLDQGKYIVVWKNDDGQWKLHRDMWSSNAAAP